MPRLRIDRLDIHEYEWWNEALHGVARAGFATVFPQAIGLAATWNTDLMHQVADVISTEARAKHHEFVRHEPARSLSRSDVLESEHQHLSRPALGTWTRDVWRRSILDGETGSRVRQRFAGQRSALSEGRCHAQTLCSAQRS